ncbi:MAG: Mur ligase family protein [Gammaproteobacteria bacterium]|tara:strand:- start:1872 stop:2939 length:1068 start_codon:yes stop_codon:yes gene_type:complete
MKKSLILGYGITGKSFTNYLTKKKLNFEIYDKNFKGKNFISFPEYKNLKKYENIYISPGFKLNKYLSEIEISSLKFQTDLDIFFKQNNSYKIGITGTNGKSTFAYYLEQILNQVSSGIIVGNFGNPVLDFLQHKKKYSIIELSSFQLEKLNKSLLDLSVVTNISPDHLDFHGNFENYKKAKLKICNNKAKTFFLNNDISLKDFAFEIASSLEKIDSNTFSPLNDLPHRLEEVIPGVINDSKSTNSASLLYAIKKLNFDGNLIICGDPSKEIKSNEILGPHQVYIFGMHRNELKDKVKGRGVKIFSNLDLVLQDIKREDAKPNILFSPGNSSGKDFKNFEDRGNFFKDKVLKYFSD